MILNHRSNYHLVFTYLILAVAFWGFSIPPIFSNNSLDTLTFFQFLEKNEIKKITLHYSVDSLIANKMIPYFSEGEVWVHLSNGDTMVLDSKFEARGKYRRKTCAFPPVKINLSEKDLRKAGLKEYDNYKLVTHCDDICESTMVLQKEFLIYKLFNVITEKSFQVYQLKVEYLDQDNDNMLIKDAFLIESNKELEDRIGYEFIEIRGLTKDNFSSFDFEVQAMFHYMINNNDIDSKMLHNAKIYRQADNQYNIIPYDFDFAKLVGAYYAHPTYSNPPYWEGEEYTGDPANQDLIDEVVANYLSKEKKLYKVISEYDGLKGFDKRTMINYLKGFFRQIKKKRVLLNYYEE